MKKELISQSWNRLGHSCVGDVLLIHTGLSSVFRLPPPTKILIAPKLQWGSEHRMNELNIAPVLNITLLTLKIL